MIALKVKYIKLLATIINAIKMKIFNMNKIKELKFLTNDKHFVFVSIIHFYTFVHKAIFASGSKKHLIKRQ